MSQGGEKTEQPTEKRLRDARKKGQVARSQDLTSSLLLVTAAAVLAIVGTQIGLQLTNAMRDGLTRATTSTKVDFDQAAAVGLFWSGMQTMAMVLAPLLIALFVISLLVSYLQVGPIFSFETIKPDLKKLNPAEGFKQKFLKPRPYIELVKMILKMTIAGVVIFAVIWNNKADIIRLTSQNVDRAATFASAVVFEIAWKVALAFVILGIADRFLQKFLHLKEMRMSKQEVREEYKETEGNPLFKSARKRLYLEMLQQSMLAAVKKADVVVVNPTHVAVALKYNRLEMEAPVVVAKGAELMATQIRKLAMEGDVPTYRDVPLARALYDIDIDSSIPEELYEAVAEVLRWVYQLAEEKKGIATHG